VEERPDRRAGRRGEGRQEGPEGNQIYRHWVSPASTLAWSYSLFRIVAWMALTPRMAVNNGVLSLTGSLLADPTNPPPPPTPVMPVRAPSASLSPEPEHAPQPAKQVRQARPTTSRVSEQAAPAAAEVIDDRYLSARDLKAKRKAEEKAKRDARKARKDERHLQEVEMVGAAGLVDAKGDIEVEGDAAQAGLGKRKAKVEDGDVGQKKRKTAQA